MPPDRHGAERSLPIIIQKISNADTKILVADGNLLRPHISRFDLFRSLRMKAGA